MTYSVPDYHKASGYGNKKSPQQRNTGCRFLPAAGILFYHLQVKTLRLPLRLQAGIQITDNLLLVHVLTDEHDFLHTVAILLIPIAHHARVLT